MYTSLLWSSSCSYTGALLPPWGSALARAELTVSSILLVGSVFSPMELSSNSSGYAPPLIASAAVTTVRPCHSMTLGSSSITLPSRTAIRLLYLLSLLSSSISPGRQKMTLGLETRRSSSPYWPPERLLKIFVTPE